MFLKIAKINETANWFFPDEMKPFIKAVYGVYFFDPNLKVHCCELTPSYELNFYESQVDLQGDPSEEMIEKIDNYIREGDIYTDPVSYIHCYLLKGKCRPGFFPENKKIGVYRESGFCPDFDTESEKDRSKVREMKHDALIEEAYEWASGIFV